MRVALIATYEMGRQPFGLASPAAWLRRAGFAVTCADLSRQPLPRDVLHEAGMVGVYLPMHTATRLALEWLPQLRIAAPRARFCAYGLYAAINRMHLEKSGFDAVLGPESEAQLVDLAGSWRDDMPASRDLGGALPKLQFVTPDRAGLPPLADYAALQLPDGRSRVTGYTEASRGCKHRCRHCPITAVYDGQFRVVAAQVALEDIRRQVAAGAEHITFGDPDFFNGPTHALRIAEAMHRQFPELSYDVTIKVEHLRRHAALLPRLAATGCTLITTAVEAFDDAVLARLEKGHTTADFLEVLRRTRSLGLALNPTFVSFTPWTTVAGFGTMLRTIENLDLVGQVAPVQYGIRLLIPPGSRMLGLPDSADWLGEYGAAALSYRWRALEPAADALCERVQRVVAGAAAAWRPRPAIFEDVFAQAEPGGVRRPSPAPQRATVPYLNEPWFC